MTYAALYRVYEIEDYIFIYISSTQAFIIPKKDLSIEENKYLRQLLQAKVKKYFNYSKK